MSTTTPESLDLARNAVSAGEWDKALELLARPEVKKVRSPETLKLTALAAYGAGDLERTVTAWESLHWHQIEAGDELSAAEAAATVALYLMMDTGLLAPVRGWLTRADSLLADHDDTPVHAVLAMVRMYERLMFGDMDSAATWAEQAIEFGTRHDVLPAVVLGRVAAARVDILRGHVEEGLAELDDVALFLLSGQLDPLATGMVYCELICAMQGLAQYDRAEQWTQAMDAWRQGTAFGGFNGRCRVHRAEILRLRGPCDEAEQEALAACEALRPWMRREFGWPLTELGAIRLRRGDLPGAEEAFLAAHEHAWEPQPGLALLRLAQGDLAAAASLIRDALEHPVDMPSKERPPFGELRRAPLLDAQVEIAVATGDVPTARAAADELTRIATTFSSKALEASASLARGRAALVADDAAQAVRECDRAVAGWVEVGAPYEAAVARCVLAEALAAGGNHGRAHLEEEAAKATFERLGARPREIPENESPTHAPSGNVFRCEGDTRRISFADQTVLLRDLKGLRYLARLLAEPGREFHVLDLVAVEHGAIPIPRPSWDGEQPTAQEGDAGPLLDQTAREAYRRRLSEVEQDIEEATAMNDLERIARAQSDRDYLINELSRAVGLAGRSRQAGSNAERARASVTRAVRYGMARIAEHHQPLGEHLAHSIQTGTYCSYQPDPRVPVSWDT